MKADRPVPALFAGVVSQHAAVASLRAAAPNPVHAYLFRGAAGERWPCCGLRVRRCAPLPRGRLR